MKQTGKQAEIAIQASSPNRTPLPLDLRKWQHTAAESGLVARVVTLKSAQQI